MADGEVPRATPAADQQHDPETRGDWSYSCAALIRLDLEELSGAS